MQHKMRRLSIASPLLLFLVFFRFAHLATAQAVVERRTSGIRTERRVDETTPITDKATGKSVSYKEYQQLMRADPYAYHLEPIYNEYGLADAYIIRPTTPEEHDTHQFYERNKDNQPKVGEPMPLFVMTGIDDKVYRSTELTGRVVVLSFWISLRKPFWGTQQAKAFADAIHPYQSETDPISLGILQDSADDIKTFMATQTLPFMPVPNSYGFQNKFQIASSPAFIVIDRAGNVAAFIDGSDYNQLTKVLAQVSR